jgi:hypothetical protein
LILPQNSSGCIQGIPFFIRLCSWKHHFAMAIDANFFFWTSHFQFKFLRFYVSVLMNITRENLCDKRCLRSMCQWCRCNHALQKKVSLYAKWFHWIFSEFTNCNEQGQVKKQWIHWFSELHPHFVAMITSLFLIHLFHCVWRFLFCNIKIFITYFGLITFRDFYGTCCNWSFKQGMVVSKNTL